MTPSKNTSLPSQSATPELLPATRVLRQFRIVFNAIKVHFRQMEKDAGIGGAHIWALSVIQETPGIGVNNLARAMDVHQSTASNLVKSLLKRKMITVVKDSTDRRTVALHLLQDGEAALRNAPAPFAGVLPNALASLDDSTLMQLEKDLNKLIAVLKADEAGANIPLANL